MPSNTLNTSNNMKKIKLLIALVLFGCVPLFAQSTVANEFEKTSEGYKYFAYQSIIRMLNMDDNPDFNRLIRNLDHLRVVMSEKSGEAAAPVFKQLDKGIQDEGFELLMSFDQKNNKCHVYELSSRSKKSTWIATFLMEGKAGLFEMVGSLDLQYIDALSSMDIDQFMKMTGTNANWD